MSYSSDSVGRTDFPDGDGPALIRSIREKGFLLSDDVSFHCGHGPGPMIALERRTNPMRANGLADPGFLTCREGSLCRLRCNHTEGVLRCGIWSQAPSPQQGPDQPRLSTNQFLGKLDRDRQSGGLSNPEAP